MLQKCTGQKVVIQLLDLAQQAVSCSVAMEVHRYPKSQRPVVSLSQNRCDTAQPALVVYCSQVNMQQP